MVYIYGANSGTPRIDAPQPLEQPAPLRTIGPIRAVTTPLGDVVAAPFSIGADTGCVNAALRVTGGGHFTARVGIGICPSSSNAGLQVTGPGNSTVRIVSTSTGPVLYISPFDDTSEALRISNAADSVTRHEFRGNGTALLSQGAGNTIIGNGTAPALDVTNGLSIRSGTGIPLALRTNNWLLVATHHTADREFRIDNTTTQLRLHHGPAASVNTADIAFEGGSLGAYWAPASAGRLALGTSSLPWGDGFLDRTTVGIATGGGVLSLKPGSSDHTYIQFFARTASPTVRSAYIGFGSGGGTTLDFANEVSAAAMMLSAGSLRPTTAGGVVLGTASLPWGSVQWGDGTRRGVLQVDGSAVYVGADTNHPLRFQTNATNRWEMQAAGHLIASTDNTYDIGASGANRPKDVYIAGNLTVGGTFNAGAKLRSSNVTSVGTGAATVETDLMTHTLPTLANGDKVDVFAEGLVTGAANTKTIRIKVGGTTIGTITCAAGTTGDYFFHLQLVKDGATLRYTVTQSPDTLGTAGLIFGANAGIDLSGAIIKTTGTTPNAADEITTEAMTIMIYSA